MWFVGVLKATSLDAIAVMTMPFGWCLVMVEVEGRLLLERQTEHFSAISAAV
jgi:hypothetical protein